MRRNCGLWLGRSAALRIAPLVVILFATLAEPTLFSDRLLAVFFAAPGNVEIVSPAEGAVVADGNLFVITARAISHVDRVEVAFDSEDVWRLADRDASDPSIWRYLWSDPGPGLHQVRVRAQGAGSPVEVQTVSFRVDSTWTTPFSVDHPYAAAGPYRKGQLHTHSTASFDGWTSLPPAELAQAYRRKGYQFVAITDHDVISNPLEQNDGSFLVIPGYESTGETGHITGLYAGSVAVPDVAPQERIDHIRASGGMAILNHPSWDVGWQGTDFRTLEGCFAFEVFNGMTTNADKSVRNLGLWHEVLNAKGPAGRIWAVAVDDAHSPESMDRAWINLKSAQLTQGAVRQALQSGAFYPSNGPSFSVLGVLSGAITASSPDATAIRFINQDNRVLAEGQGSWAGYFPHAGERWIRVEAIANDGRRAWSQPFWINWGTSAAGASPKG